MRTARFGRVAAGVSLAVCLVLGTAGCGGDPAALADGRVRLRLGHLVNLTHATAIMGVADGTYARALGEDVAFSTATFNAGPEAMEALFSGVIDATFVGPGPTINAHAVSDGRAVRVVAGATSGGAALVVRPDIDGPQDLRGRTLASPQLGNTQDVALRAWLAEQGLVTDLRGGGDVQVQPQGNPQIVEGYRSGAIDGAWVPEPWASRLVQQEGAKVLVDEAELWPGGRYVTTHLLVRAEYLERHPEQVRALLRGHVEATRRMNEEPEDARRTVEGVLADLAGQSMDARVLHAAWANLTFTVDPVAASLRRGAEYAAELGLIEPVDLDGLYALEPLNEVLRAVGRPEVEA